MPWFIKRTVTITDGARTEAHLARSRYPRIDQAVQGLTWLFERNPEPVGSFAQNYGGTDFLLYGVDGDSTAGLPELWVVYWYNDDEVVIEALNVTDPSNDPEEE